MNLWIWSKLFFFSAGFSEDMNLMSMFLPMRSLGSLCESSFHQPYRIACGWGDIELGSWISYCELKRRSSPLDFLLFRQERKTCFISYLVVDSIWFHILNYDFPRFSPSKNFPLCFPGGIFMSNLEVVQLTSLIHRLREEAPPEADCRGFQQVPEDFFEDYSSKGSHPTKHAISTEFRLRIYNL